MDIPNLSNQPPATSQTKASYSIPVVIFIIIVALVSGLGLSRLFPKSANAPLTTILKSNHSSPVSADDISSADQLVVGKLYGNSAKAFKDTATGVIEKGNINGEGTHILNREGGLSQRASLTSSTVDLDLFIGKKVEVKGETNASNKTSWLLDVGSIKILE